MAKQTSSSSTTVSASSASGLMLLSAALEAWAHQVLYTRRVYPKETFGKSRFLGVQIYVNRHPAVVSYIHDTVRLATPTLWRGDADQLSLMITCEQEHYSTPYDTSIVAEAAAGGGSHDGVSNIGDGETDSHVVVTPECLEEYTLRLVGGAGRCQHQHQQQQQEEEELLKRSLRDLVLKVHGCSLEVSPSVSPASSGSSQTNISFRLELSLTELATNNNNNKNGSQPSGDLSRALADGTWFTPSMDQDPSCSSSSSSRGGHVVRPLHRTETPVGTLHFVQRRRVSPSTRSRRRTTRAPATPRTQRTSTEEHTIEEE